MRRVDRIRDEPVLRARRSRSASHPALARLARPRLSCRPRALDVPSRAPNVDITTRSITSPRPRVLRRRHCRARARPRRWCPFARIRRRPRARPSSRRALVADARCRPRRRNGLASSISEGARAFPPTHRARRASNHPARACDPSRSAIHGHPTNETRETDDDARIASRERSNDARDGLRDRRARVGRTLDASTRRRRR